MAGPDPDGALAGTAFFISRRTLIVSLSTHHLITFCLAAVVVVAVGVVLHERRRRRGLIEIMRRLIRRRPRYHADEFPF